MPKECQLKPKTLDKSRFYPRSDPPKSPESEGEFEKILVPPFLRGVRGDLDLIAKQQFLTGFDLKLTLLGLLECPDFG